MSVPSATTPSTTVGPVTVPSVSTPTASTPSVSTPTASAPSVSAPSVSAPSVSAPAVSAPTVSSSTGGRTPATSVSSAPARAGSTPAGASGAPAPSGAGAPAAGTARAAAAQSGRGGGRASAAPARRVRAPARPTRHERLLRSSVRRFGACLTRLGRLERRVLVLRAGLGRAHPRSRAAVAHITGLRVRRVARIEARGLRRLRALGRQGCAPPPGTQAAPAAGSAAPLVAVGLFGTRTAPKPGSPRTPHMGVKDTHASGRASHPKPAGSQPGALAEGPPLLEPGGSGHGGVPVAILIALVLLAYVVYVVRAERRT
ncbi:MAG: hypothetical protein ACXVFN_09990 [Solirubrobacteraceae bacterium]